MMEQLFTAPLSLADLFLSGHSLYSWTYNSKLELLYTNCPYAESLNPLLLKLQEQTQRVPALDRPVALTDSLGLTWIVDFESEGRRLLRLHIIGPALHADLVPDIRQTDLSQLPLTPQQREKLPDLIRQLPILSLPNFMDYGLMLHYTLTGKKLTHGDFQCRNEFVNLSGDRSETARRRISWLAEQSFLKMVEEGAPEYLCCPQREYLFSTEAHFPPGVPPLRQRKNSAIVFCALCARAAIRGGLAPETALALNSRYGQDMETCHSLPELMATLDAMLADFVQRVSDQKQRQGISLQVQQCCDYIQLHLSEKLMLSELAAHVGYSSNYLTQKFHRETGQTLSEYILTSRMERAKDLLTGTLLSMQEISKQLGYAGLSYFSEQFKRYTGQTPSAYRRAQAEGSDK